MSFEATSNPTLATSDIEIGAVEIKNYNDDTRAEVDGNRQLRTNPGPLQSATDTVGIAGTTGVSIDFSAALEPSSVTKASAGRLYKISGRIDSTAATATYYLQILNASSVPADGAVTYLCAPLKIIHTNGTNSTFDMDFTIDDQYSGITASTGIVWCISTTEFTKTVAGSIASVNALYV